KPQHRIGAEALGVVLGTVGEVEKLAFRIYGSPLLISTLIIITPMLKTVFLCAFKQRLINQPHFNLLLTTSLIDIPKLNIK
ncbi:hypothetical protein, partial [Sutterella seckii]|uniref:hypothetical protein n=1 Tax=Sutterella seckii TaxID=1944635 RepID=UPI001D05A440